MIKTRGGVGNNYPRLLSTELIKFIIFLLIFNRKMITFAPLKLSITIYAPAKNYEIHN